MKRTMIYVLAMLVAMTTVVAIAQSKQLKPATNQPVGCFAACQKALGLSQSQIAEMTKIKASFVNDTATLRTDLQAKMKEIANLWTAESPDLQLIKQKSADADQVRALIRDKAIDTRGAILKVLTPAQRATCIKMCQSGQCNCGMCGGCGMCVCGTCCGNAAGACSTGMGAGKGCGGAGIGMGGGCGMSGACPLRQ